MGWGMFLVLLGLVLLGFYFYSLYFMPTRRYSPGRENPLEIAKTCLGRGEITPEEYEEIVEKIRQDK